MATSSKPPGPGPGPSPEMPNSKPLQIFLLVALVISGASYVADEWNQIFAPRHVPPDRLHRLVESRTEYASHMESGVRLLRHNQYEQALAQFRLAIQAQNSAEAHFNMASTLLKLNRSEEALAQFKEAVRLNPHYTEVYLAWGQALMNEGRTDEAEPVFREALHVSPNSALAQFDIALALVAQKKLVQADQQSAEDQGRAVDAVVLAAKAERLRADALQRLSQAKRFGLDRSDFWLAYGELLNEAQKYDEAESSLRTAVSSKPNVADAHFALGEAEGHLAKFEAAIAQYQATLVLRPDDPLSLDRLALIYATATNLDLRSTKMAIQLATRANDATTAQNPRMMDTLARCYAEDGDFLQAINWENQAIKRAGQLHDVRLTRELQPRYDLFVQHKTR